MIQYQAYKYVKDIICHFIFLTFTVSYPVGLTRFFFQNQAMSRKLSPNLPNLNGMQDSHRWVNNIFLPLIHNPYHSSYLLNTWSKVLGLPRMRQIRRKYSAVGCVLPHELKNTFVLHNVHCKKKYGFDQEDQTNYLSSWRATTNTSALKHHSEFLNFSYEPSSTQ